MNPDPHLHCHWPTFYSNWSLRSVAGKWDPVMTVLKQTMTVKQRPGLDVYKCW